MNNKQVTIQEGQEFPLTIKRLGINGEGVGFFKRQVVFVPGALPGEVVVARVEKVQNKFVQASMKKIREKSPHRIQPPCPIYHKCGGCQLQHLAYPQQLEEKRDHVIQAMERHTKLRLDKIDIRETIGMDDPWYYRNKSQLQTTKEKGKVLAGLYQPNSHKIVDLSQCMVQHEKTNEVTQVVKDVLQELNIPIYDERDHSGGIRTIVVRTAIATGETQLVLVTVKEKIPKKELLIEEIQKRVPNLTSIMQNINGKRTSLIFGEDTLHLAGEEVIQETLGDLSFELSARAFFQLNPVQTVKLYDEVKKAAKLTGKEKVVDAYCGVGTIGLWVANEAAELRGMDIIEESIKDAKKNADKFAVTHANYYVGKAEQLLPKWTKEGWRPDVVIVDPPRTGCDNKLLNTLLKVKPKKIVYVSCNPSTLAKDIQTLSGNYKVKYMQPVDMFPQTSHVEVISKIELK
ncbi:23S rRNA (uracil(1939)-C(5))-methyltransferase RlmD [Bacillus solimangrovi]|uniref:23S rRNA (Uracil-5-)-methyltransferase RumA n=1 Tax=Bacillus solimangrovi TaxID=1305675 RepID=A0A1E5LB85_9BACI|nr:23S rRNA (uracil(1939)-C(5))-methyltransferase RlmD [Bacillus solimangrovi]OEH91342.1 23S rRNA (uracil-5-)-methyltransferase RumA [Bacillus solimangrovi]